MDKILTVFHTKMSNRVRAYRGSDEGNLSLKWQLRILKLELGRMRTAQTLLKNARDGNLARAALRQRSVQNSMVFYDYFFTKGNMSVYPAISVNSRIKNTIKTITRKVVKNPPPAGI